MMRFSVPKIFGGTARTTLDCIGTGQDVSNGQSGVHETYVCEAPEAINYAETSQLCGPHTLPIDFPKKGVELTCNWRVQTTSSWENSVSVASGKIIPLILPPFFPDEYIPNRRDPVPPVVELPPVDPLLGKPRRMATTSSAWVFPSIGILIFTFLVCLIPSCRRLDPVIDTMTPAAACWKSRGQAWLCLELVYHAALILQMYLLFKPLVAITDLGTGLEEDYESLDAWGELATACFIFTAWSALYQALLFGLSPAEGPMCPFSCPKGTFMVNKKKNKHVRLRARDPPLRTYARPPPPKPPRGFSRDLAFLPGTSIMEAYRWMMLSALPNSAETALAGWFLAVLNTKRAWRTGMIPIDIAWFVVAVQATSFEPLQSTAWLTKSFTKRKNLLQMNISLKFVSNLS